MRRFLRNSRGIALILTILIISLIVALTLQFNTSMRSDLAAAVNVRDGIRFGYLAKSGFNYALAVLLEDRKAGGVDSLLEAWAPEEIKSSSETNSAELFGSDRFSVKVSACSGWIQINNLVDNNGKFNEPQKGLLTRFLKSSEFGLDSEQVDNIVDAIKDWIDEDDDPTGFGGAENSYYQTLDKPYACKNAPVECLEELLLIKGITKELFDGTKEKPGIASYLSPYGDDGKININTAPDLVLRALSDGIDGEMIRDMDEYRTEPENKDNLSNPNWYKSVSGMGGVNIDPNLLTTSSAFFEIRSEGQKRVKRKEDDKDKWLPVKQVTAIVERKDQEFNIVSWKIE